MIYHFAQTTNMRRKCIIFKPGRLRHVYLFVKTTLKKNIIDDEMSEYLVVVDCKREHYANGCLLNYWTKCRVKINAWPLSEALCNKISFVSIHGSIDLSFNPEQLLTSIDIFMGSHGIDSHIWFFSRVSNSTFMAALHSRY